jgi:2-polyprenyl-6-methoxyphenol hydroxylase-like FAD-dependent oxidoreductase
MMLGYMLARAGIDVVVLEKHRDFLRDCRGDTIHPSTLEVMHELGLLPQLLQLPHRRADHLAAMVGGKRFQMADFDGLPARCRYIAFMPQWDFLDLLAREAAKFPGFRLCMQTETVGLTTAGDRITGVQARSGDRMLEIAADLVVGADGRASTVRAAAGMQVRNLGAPMDVLWFRFSKADSDPQESIGVFGTGAIFVLIDRGTHWQCGYVIPKGGYDALRQDGLGAFRAAIGRLAPFLAQRAGEIATWDDVKLLTVAVDRLRQWWRPGLLCIGDAAHAMSPIGGVGINLAIQDAVAAGNILAEPLRQRRVGTDDLARVQARRAWPAIGTQTLQLIVQRRIVAPLLGAQHPVRAPLALQVLSGERWIRRLIARLVGLGLRPEHVSAGLLGPETRFPR